MVLRRHGESVERSRGQGKLYVFSDGAYEISRPDGHTLQLADFVQQLGQPVAAGQLKLDELVKWAQTIGAQASLVDDLSILEIEL